MHDIPDRPLAVNRGNSAVEFEPARAAVMAEAPKISDAVAYLDSLTIYCWRPLPLDAFMLLRDLYGRRLITKLKKRRSRTRGKFKAGPSIQRTRVTIHQPDTATLKHLQDLQHDRFAISEVHVAVDFLCSSPEEAEHLRAFLQTSMVQRWRRKGQNSHVELSTTYANRNKRVSRNSAIYAARPSKTGHGPCCHVELRFVGAQACKRAGKRIGLNNFDVLITGVDAFALLNHEARLVLVDPRAVNSRIERFARISKRRYAKTTVTDLRERLAAFSAPPPRRGHPSRGELHRNRAGASLLRFRASLARLFAQECRVGSLPPPPLASLVGAGCYPQHFHFTETSTLNSQCFFLPVLYHVVGLQVEGVAHGATTKLGTSKLDGQA